MIESTMEKHFTPEEQLYLRKLLSKMYIVKINKKWHIAEYDQQTEQCIEKYKLKVEINDGKD